MLMDERENHHHRRRLLTASAALSHASIESRWGSPLATKSFAATTPSPSSRFEVTAKGQRRTRIPPSAASSRGLLDGAILDSSANFSRWVAWCRYEGTVRWRPVAAHSHSRQSSALDRAHVADGGVPARETRSPWRPSMSPLTVRPITSLAGGRRDAHEVNSSLKVSAISEMESKDKGRAAVTAARSYFFRQGGASSYPVVSESPHGTGAALLWRVAAPVRAGMPRAEARGQDGALSYPVEISEQEFES